MGLLTKERPVENLVYRHSEQQNAAEQVPWPQPFGRPSNKIHFEGAACEAVSDPSLKIPRALKSSYMRFGLKGGNMCWTVR